MKSHEKQKRTEQAPHHPSQSQKERIITEVGPNDVLFGRGFQVNNNQGNMRYRELLRQRKAEYSATVRRQRKHNIAKEIVDCIYMKNGRFLQKSDSKIKPAKKGTLAEIPSSWKIVDTDIAIEKVKQALRDFSEKKTNNTATALDFGTAAFDNDSDPPAALPLHIQQPMMNFQQCNRTQASTADLSPPSPATGHNLLMRREAALPGHSVSNVSDQLGLPSQDGPLQPQQLNPSFLALAQRSQLFEVQQVLQNILARYSPNPSLPSFHQLQMLTNSTPLNLAALLELIKQNNDQTENISEATSTRDSLSLQPTLAHPLPSFSNQDLVSFIAGLSEEQKAEILSALISRGA